MLNRLKIGTKIGASFALGLTIFAVIGVVSYRGTKQLVDTARQETHTYQVLGGLEDILSLVKDAETGQRGYILTGEQSYLVPYNTATKSLQQKVQETRSLTADNPNQQRLLNTLEPLIASKLAELEETISLRQTQGMNAALKVVKTNQGKQIMNEIRLVIGQMEAKEHELLRWRSGVADAAARNTLDSITYGSPFAFLLLALIGILLTRTISKPLKEVSDMAERIADGELSISLPQSDRSDEVGVLTRTFNHMIANLRDTTQKNQEQTWLKSNLAEFSQMLQGQRNLETISRLFLSNLVPLVGAQQGVFYGMELAEDQPVLKLLSSYADRQDGLVANQFRLGEGLIGQCALGKQKILLTEVPRDYIRIRSGLGEAPPLSVIVLPVLFETQIIAVIELASFQRFSEIHLTFLEQVSEIIGVVLNTVASDLRTQQLLEESQTLTEELQAQQEELQESNQRLEEQAKALQKSEWQLQQSNENLQQLNQELEEKAESLALQKREVEQKNQEIERTRQALEEKAAQLTLSSRYKSEFLANMSHELRTPLNSLLILARLLAENANGNLTDKQVEYSQTIYSAGTDLLTLINDILDLAKIESGNISVQIEQITFASLEIYLERTFRQVAQDKKLSFMIELGENLPPAISTDPKRLQQVLNNLLANAFKFTQQGGVTLRIKRADGDVNAPDSIANNSLIAFAVSDTGIGVAAEQQQIIFEAFQQVDGTISRKYGGTGLGLSISRELADLLGGTIQLVSQPGQGSTFTLYLPQTYVGSYPEVPQPGRLATDGDITNQDSGKPAVPPFATTAAIVNQNFSAHPEIPDDRETIQPNDCILLIVEDDLDFARILLEIARQQGFKVLVALRGHSGLALAQQFKPDAIMLDIYLPDMNGWKVLERLKHDPNSRHIPIHILSSSDDRQQLGLKLGAIAYLQKPISPQVLIQTLTDIKGFVERQVKNLLVVEDDLVQARSIVELIGNGDVRSTAVGTGAEALAALRSSHFDCVVMDLGLPDMSGFDLIEQIKQEPSRSNLPIIVYTGKELTPQEETQLKRLAETIIVKDVRSPERLLAETTLFLHRVQANLPESKRQILEQLHHINPALTGKKVLIVDDDVRNIFALTSLLERYQMQVLFAENGLDGIATLQSHPEIDLILMDIMMPEMDGYETTRVIRQQEQYQALPIIALTAKAMQDDREKCIAAGASDYITKPVDTEQLLSLLRVWLYR